MYNTNIVDFVIWWKIYKPKILLRDSHCNKKLGARIILKEYDEWYLVYPDMSLSIASLTINQSRINTIMREILAGKCIASRNFCENKSCETLSKVEFAKLNSIKFASCKSFSRKRSPRYDKWKEKNLCEKELKNYIRSMRPIYELQYPRHWKLSVFEQISFLWIHGPGFSKSVGAKKAEGFFQAIVDARPFMRSKVQCPVET